MERRVSHKTASELLTEAHEAGGKWIEVCTKASRQAIIERDSLPEVDDDAFRLIENFYEFCTCGDMQDIADWPQSVMGILATEKRNCGIEDED